MLESMKTALDALRRLGEITQKFKDAEVKNIIADLRLSLASVKTELADLMEENIQLKQALHVEQNDFETDDAQPEVKNDTYWFLKPGLDEQDGRFCMRCWDVDRRRVRVRESGRAFRHSGKYFCPQCKTHFGGV